MPIRLFFRPSNIADAAISIFELSPSSPPPPPLKRIQDIRRAERSANSIDLLRRFSGRSPPPETVVLTLTLALSPNGDALYVSVADPLAARRYISFHDSVILTVPGCFCPDTLRARCTNFLLAPRISRGNFNGTITKSCSCMRTWVASMDRFDVLVDAGNSPLLPSTATRYRSPTYVGIEWTCLRQQ